tara:strand:+ start:383 stop:1468 length:1086 start_codon:yes stop_codon:yes gene_type:complete
MRISWVVNHNIDTSQSEGRYMYKQLKTKFPDLRMDIMDGSTINGNKLPNYIKRYRYDKIFKKSKYKSYLNYLWIKKHPVDILHVYHSYLFRKFLSLIELEKRPKIVFTLHGSDTYIRPWVSQDWTDFYLKYGKHVDAFITFSNNQKEYLNRWGVPFEKIYAIPTGAPDSFSTPRTIKFGNSIKLLSVFRLSWHKNILGNLTFIKELKNHFEDVEYHIFGSGDNEELAQLYYLKDKLDIVDNVKFKGKIENNILLDTMNDYDFLLHLSISESIPTSVVEAQSRGLVPIVSNVGGLSEIVQHKETGFIREFSDINGFIDDISRVKTQSNDYKKMSSKCIKNFKKNYTTKKVCDKIIKVYNSIV